MRIGTQHDQEHIILDFHAGSGTTAQATIELNQEDGGNRKYILCEQMDYINDVTVKRVQKIIQREKIDSHFIYCEIKELSEGLIVKIKNSSAGKDYKASLERSQ